MQPKFYILDAYHYVNTARPVGFFCKSTPTLTSYCSADPTNILSLSEEIIAGFLSNSGGKFLTTFFN